MSPANARKPASTSTFTTSDDKGATSAAAGLEDVTRALRELTRSGRELLTEGGEVLERELSMAVAISERIRTETLTDKALQEARSTPLNQRLRDDAHRVVDVVADVSGVAVLSAVRFVERFADEPRPRLAREERASSGEPSAVAAHG